MLKKIAMAGGIGAVLLGSGTAALAASGSHHLAASASTSSTTSTASASASPTSTGAHAGGRHGRPDGRFGHGGPGGGHGGFGGAGEVEHGQWVTRNAAGTDVTRDEVSGAVTAVSTSSISVKATDGFTATYVVSRSTKVFTGHSKTAGTIAAVKVGDTVTVVGTGTATLTATFISEHPTGSSKPTTSASPSATSTS